MKYYDSMGFESPDGIWARRADVVDIEYSIKLQRLIENLKYDTETPYPELHHHKMIVAAKGRIRELETELAECRNSRQREHDLRVTLAGELESFKIRYQDEVNARVNAENELDAVRSGFVAELRKAKAALATARIAALARQGDGR
jgi:hypothetical protein